MDQMETLGLGQVAEKVEELTRVALGGVTITALPKAALPSGLLVEDPHVLVVSDGKGSVKVESLAPHIDALRGKPARRKGTATAATLESFSDLVNRNGDRGTAIFVDADWRKPKLTAVLNYHLPIISSENVWADPVLGDDPLARFNDHRVVYVFPLSEPWKAWVAMDGKPMGQGEFAAFLEDHIHEIAAESDSAEERRWKEDFRTTIASPSDLIDLARGLEINVGQKVASKVKLASGETQMVFETEHRSADGKELTVPGLFLLSVPVFYRGEAQRMPVRLRYRIDGGELRWFYQIFRPDEFVDRRVRSDVLAVAEATGLTVFDGAPEAA